MPNQGENKLSNAPQEAKLENMNIIQTAILNKAKELEYQMEKTMSLDYSYDQDSVENYMGAMELFENIIKNRALIINNVRNGRVGNRMGKNKNFVIGASQESDDVVAPPIIKKMLNKALILKQNHDGSENRGKRNELWERIVASNKRTLTIKTGSSLCSNLEKRPWKEVVDWAVKYADHTESTLEHELFELDDEINCVDATTSAIAKTKLFSRVSIPVIPKYQAAEYTSSHIHKSKEPSEDNKEGKGKKQHLRVPLGPKLDKIRNDRTELFLAEILKGSVLKRAPLVPSKSFHGATSKRDTVSRDGNSNDFSPRPPSGNGASIQSNRRRSVMMAVPASPPMTVNNSSKEKKEGETVRSEELMVGEQNSQSVDVVDEDGSLIASKKKTGSKDRSFKPSLSINTASDPLNNPGSSSITSPRSVNHKMKTYSNCKVNIANTLMDNPDDEVCEESKAQLKRFQQGVESVTHKMSTLASEYNTALTEIAESSDGLLNQWDDFYLAQKFQHNLLIYTVDHKEFLFPEEMMYNLRCLDTDGIDWQHDVAAMKKKARVLLHMKGMYNITNNRWIVNAISKLKDYVKKTKQMVPICCYRFLMVLKNIAMIGVVLSNDMFYYVMERCLRNPTEEHGSVLVYETLKFARDVVNISAEEYLEYLKSHSYAECPKLLEQIRINKDKKSRSMRLELQKQNSRGLPSYNSGISMSGVGSPPPRSRMSSMDMDDAAMEEYIRVAGQSGLIGKS